MLVRVLGSIEAIGEGDGDGDIALGGAIQRRIMAILALEAGEVVSLDRLVEISWHEGEAPAQAERNVRTYVHRFEGRSGLRPGRSDRDDRPGVPTASGFW